MRLALLPPTRRSADSYDFVLLNVRSVNISQARLRLEPVRGRLGAGVHPLRRLHIELGVLAGDLQDGALQGLGYLEHFSLDLIEGGSTFRSALADLPLLQELVIVNTHFQFVNPGLVTRTPRLRRLRFTNSRFDFMASDAIVVENDSDDDVEGSGACSPDDDALLNFSDMVVNTMSSNAVRVSSVSRLLASNNSIGVMYTGALNVSLRAPSADCRPLFRFTMNSLTDVRNDAVAVENETPTPADLEIGGNVLLQTALSPFELRLHGAFERRPVAGLRPDQFECNCCECPGTRQLIDVALQPRPSRLDTDAFVAMLGGARCAGVAQRSFLEFADGCVQDTDLKARVASLLPDFKSPDSKSGGAARQPAVGPLALLLALAAAGRG